MVHNQIDSATSLLIPERFFVLHQQFLERPWDEFRPGWHYWKDVGYQCRRLHSAGLLFPGVFLPVRNKRAIERSPLRLGFAVSLTIEVLQAFLPTRDSGMTDLITNTFGTALGATACVWSIKHNWFAKTGLPSVHPLDKY